MDLAGMLRRSAHQYSSRTAVVGRSGRRTFGELDDRAGRLAGALRERGLVQGDRVAVLLENRLEYPEIDVGLAYGGFTRVALNIRQNVVDFQLMVSDCSARAIISEPRFDETVATLCENLGLLYVRLGDEPSDVENVSYDQATTESKPYFHAGVALERETAWISYTSGTTGRPKGVMLSHHALTHVAFNLMIETGPTDETGSVLLPQPLSHGAGYFSLAYLASGASVHVVPSFDPDEIRTWGVKENVKCLKLVPTMLNRLLEVDNDAPLPFEKIIYGASPISGPILDSALEAFGPVLMQIYGQSEAPVTITCLKQHDHARPGPHLRSAGRPWRSVELKVVDGEGQEVPTGEIGEAIVKGEHVMTGYYGLPELTAEVLRDGWVWTKDLAMIDEGGYVYLRGRSDDMIISGGFNVAPKEVEEVILRHPSVLECAVVGIPDEEWGQRVAAFIVLRTGKQSNEEELGEFSRSELGYRRPRIVNIIDQLPYTPYGKVDRKKLVAEQVANTKAKENQ